MADVANRKQIKCSMQKIRNTKSKQQRKHTDTEADNMELDGEMIDTLSVPFRSSRHIATRFAWNKPAFAHL